MTTPAFRASRRSFLAVAALAAAAPTAAAAAPTAAAGRTGRAVRIPPGGPAAGQAPQTSVRSGSLGTLLRTVPLAATLDHPQGITASADGGTWYVSSVLRKEQKGLLVAFRASDGSVVQRVEVQDGPRYHPGGLARSGDVIWVPVAEYRNASTSVIQARDARTLALQRSFAVADHIGAVAVTTAGALIGCNWDARVFYEWNFDGVETQKVDHLGAARYQDLHWTGETLLAGGLLGDDGVIDTLEWPSLDLRERIVVGKTDRGVVVTHEGLAVAGKELLLMPEDDPSRVFVHAWAGPQAPEPAPRGTEPEKSLFKKPRP
jgi:hypothetical protein